MFTGLIEAQGTVTDLSGEGLVRARLKTDWQKSDLSLGASVAHDGGCLTIVDWDDGWHEVEISPETLSKTTMRTWQLGQKVNLERSLKVGDELGGHFVTGHVDGLGQVESITPQDECWHLVISAPAEIMPYVATKGSVAVDGVSLTVNLAHDDRFELMIIPHTAEVTTLGRYRAGQAVNLEVDLIARYLRRQMDWQMPGSAKD